MVVESSEMTVKCRCREQGLFAVLTSAVRYIHGSGGHGVC